MAPGRLLEINSRRKGSSELHPYRSLTKQVPGPLVVIGLLGSRHAPGRLPPPLRLAIRRPLSPRHQPNTAEHWSLVVVHTHRQTQQRVTPQNPLRLLPETKPSGTNPEQPLNPFPIRHLHPSRHHHPDLYRLVQAPVIGQQFPLAHLGNHWGTCNQHQ